MDENKRTDMLLLNYQLLFEISPIEGHEILRPRTGIIH